MEKIFIAVLGKDDLMAFVTLVRSEGWSECHVYDVSQSMIPYLFRSSV